MGDTFAIICIVSGIAKTGNHKPPMAAKITTDVAPKGAACSCVLAKVPIKTPKPIAANPENNATTVNPINFPSTSNAGRDRKSTRLNSSHVRISYAVFCLKKKKKKINKTSHDTSLYAQLRTFAHLATTLPGAHVHLGVLVGTLAAHRSGTDISSGCLNCPH